MASSRRPKLAPEVAATTSLSPGTSLAVPSRVRTLLLILALCSRVGADPLWDAEVRLGYGVAVGGGGGMTSTRPTPLSIAVLGSVLVNEEPMLSGYGGLTVETLDRNSIGVLGGVKLVPQGSPLRLMGGGTWVFAPLTLWGATASGGACGHVSHGMGMYTHSTMHEPSTRNWDESGMSCTASGRPAPSTARSPSTRSARAGAKPPSTSESALTPEITAVTCTPRGRAAAMVTS